MKYWYDLHIHSCLSACADRDMSASNIVGMAKLIGLDIIAITDHNSTLNCAGAVAASKRIGGPLVVPGIELETLEGIHTILLFPSISAAEAANTEIQNMLPCIKNQADIQQQQIMDEFDNIIGYEQKALSLPTKLGVYQLKDFGDKFGAVVFPAHIDRPTNGLLGILGGLDQLMGFNALEVSNYAPKDLLEELKKNGYKILQSSDAHALHLINEKTNFLELKSLGIQQVLNSIKDKKQ